jgi:hypothetical protein
MTGAVSVLEQVPRWQLNLALAGDAVGRTAISSAAQDKLAIRYMKPFRSSKQRDRATLEDAEPAEEVDAFNRKHFTRHGFRSGGA